MRRIPVGDTFATIDDCDWIKAHRDAADAAEPGGKDE